ncbi:MAG: hypothetical protein JNK82_19695, partial [Myxococcaceae bacterium]|nr:hypothetical protein [Myxococcaceae bacterium]
TAGGGATAGGGSATAGGGAVNAGGGATAGGGSPTAGGGMATAGGAGCTQLATWPNAATSGRYVPGSDATVGYSFRSATFPTDLLTLDFFHPATLPASETFTPSTRFIDCNICPYLRESCSPGAGNAEPACSMNGRLFFPQAGSVTVTTAARDAGSGAFSATATNLRLVEWDYDDDLPVEDGGCYQLGSVSLNVTW